MKWRVYRVTAGSWSREVEAPNVRWAVYQASTLLPKKLPDTRLLKLEVEYVRDAESW